MGKMRIAYSIMVGKSEDSGTYGNIILEWLL
jgi:hypothetical protein